MNLANETLLRLAALPNIAGVLTRADQVQSSFDLARCGTRAQGFAIMTGVLRGSTTR